VDDKTVVFELSSPNGAFQAALGDLISFVVQDGIAGSPEELKDMSKEDFDRLEVWQAPPVSSAPLQWVASVPDQFVELAPNPSWYGDPVPWERVLGRPVDLAVAATALQAGDIDMSLVPLGEIQRLSDLGFGTAIVEFPFPYIGEVNLVTGRLADVRTRQGLAHACDSAAFTEEYFSGAASYLPTYIQAEWVPTEGLNYYEYDPVRAKELFDAANWDYNQPIRWLTFAADDVNLNAYIDTCQSQLAEIGIQVEGVSGADSVGPLVEGGEFEIYSHGGPFTKYDPELLAPALTCAGIPGGVTPGTYQDVSNGSNYCNPELDALFEQARLTSDQAERADLFHQASLIFNEDLPYFVHMPATMNLAWDPAIQVEPAYPVHNYIDRWSRVP
jgi:peptide/nickel transport system substrate-binding protein